MSERRRRFRGFRLWGSDPAAEVAAEVSYHLERRVEDLRAEGLSEDEAWREARRAFGDVDRIGRELRRRGRRRARRRARSALLGDVVGDARITVRSLVRRRGYAAAVLLTLGLGIGATTAVFSLVNGILLRPLPYPEPERLAVVWERHVPRERGENVTSVRSYEAWLAAGRSFGSMAALVPDRSTLGGERPARIAGAAVTPSWFAVHGVAPALGRSFTESEATSAAQVVVLSDGLWRERLGGDASVVGRAVRLDGRPATVVGVMPAGFEPPAYGWLGPGQRYWVPFAPDPQNRQWGRFLLVLGRLRDDAGIAQATAELRAVADRFAEEDVRQEGWTVDVVGLHDQVIGRVRPALLVLFAAVGFLLAAAVVNVTTLLLARAQARRLEFAVRAALGAGRGRILRQLLAEAAVLAGAGATFGILVAFAVVEGLAAVFPPDLPRAGNVAVDPAALGFAAAVTVLATLVAAVVPALRVTRPDGHGDLRTGGRTASAAGGGGKLVVAEVALALVLTVGAGLAMRSFAHLRSTPLGFDAGEVVSARVTLPDDGYGEPAARLAFYDDLLARVRALPGVRAAAAVNARPLACCGSSSNVYREDGSMRPESSPVADIRVATPEYFRTLGIPLLAGRSFDGTDPVAGDPPVVINRTMAQLLWPGEDPVGRPVTVGLSNPTPAVVAGVVGDVRISGPASAIRSTVYFPHDRYASGQMDVVVRGALAAETLVPMLRDAVASLDGSLPVYDATTLERAVSLAVAQDRVNFLLLAGFSIVALLLAGTGIYGLLALEVGRRRHEIGIRLALGATPGRVRAGVVATGLRLALAGAAIGVAAAFGLTRYMAGLLHGVTPTDAATYAGVAGVLLTVAVLAAYLPARRATRVDPLEAIRAE